MTTQDPTNLHQIREQLRHCKPGEVQLFAPERIERLLDEYLHLPGATQPSTAAPEDWADGLTAADKLALIREAVAYSPTNRVSSVIAAPVTWLVAEFDRVAALPA
jgi:hypothetical protein